MKTDFSILSGKVSHLSTTAAVHGSVNKGKGDINTSHKSHFRVNGRPAVYNDAINLANSDRVTLVGKIKRGTFHVRVLRVEDTGLIYSGMTKSAYIIGSLLILASIASLLYAFIFGNAAVLVGGATVATPIGLWLIFEGHMNHSAIRFLP